MRSALKDKTQHYKPLLEFEKFHLRAIFVCDKRYTISYSPLAKYAKAEGVFIKQSTSILFFTKSV